MYLVDIFFILIISRVSCCHVSTQVKHTTTNTWWVVVMRLPSWLMMSVYKCSWIIWRNWQFHQPIRFSYYIFFWV